MSEDRFNLPGGWSLLYLPSYCEWHFFDADDRRVMEYCQLRETAEAFAKAMNSRSSELNADLLTELKRLRNFVNRTLILTGSADRATADEAVADADRVIAKAEGKSNARSGE